MQISKTECKISPLGKLPKDWSILKLEFLCSRRKYEFIKSETYIGLEHIGQGTNSLISKGNIKDFTSTKNSFLKGDILYGKLRPLLNKVYLAEENGYCSTDILPLVVNNKVLNSILLWNLSSQRFVRYADSTSSGTKMPRTNWDDMKNFMVAIPPIKEQQKITSILSNLERLIQKTDQTIEQTHRLKIGLSNSLLIKGIGHTKFKKTELGENPEEWDIKKLVDISSNGIRNGVFKKRADYGNGVPLVNVSDLFSEDDIDVAKLERVNVSREELKQFQIEEGDIFFCRSSLVADGIGRSNIVSYLPEPAVFECHVMMIRPNRNLVNPKFLSYYTDSNIAKRFLYSIAKTLTMTTIRQPDLERLPVPLPSLIEQGKIASILSRLDDMIKKQRKQKNNHEKLKKGLMQQLLNGKIRVKA